tara:strand:- start:726 stop:932 length:207 start_codon:yes stop_codon:yes gene_type:complete
MDLIDYFYKKLIYHRWIKIEKYLKQIDKYIANKWTKHEIKEYIDLLVLAGKIYYWDKFIILYLIKKMI